MFKLISNERKQISGCLVMCGGGNERKGLQKSTFGCDSYVHYLKFGDSFKAQTNNKTNQIV